MFHISRRRRSLFLSSGLIPPTPGGWFDGGYPLGFTSTIMFPGESSITTINADTTTFNDTTIENASPSCRFVLEPGNYTMAPSEFHDFYVESKDFIHIVGKNQAWVNGAPNVNGTYLTGFTLWQNDQVLLENLIFNDISDLYDASGGPDYATYSNQDINIQLKNCVFAGQYIHDISFKRANDIAEVVGCKFKDSERHCIEVGQEINYLEDPTQVVNARIIGNEFIDPKLHGVSIMASKFVEIDNNLFSNVGSRPIRQVILNGTPNPEMTLRMLSSPMRTEVTNNTFVGDLLPSHFDGRGRVDDVVYVHGNTGVTSADFEFFAMFPEDAVLFSDDGDPVETQSAPTLDPASDI